MSKKVIIANTEVISNDNTGVSDPFYEALGSWRIRGQGLFYKRRKNIPFRMVVQQVETFGTSKTDSVLDSGFKVTLDIQPSDVGKTDRIMDFVTLGQRYEDYSAEVVLPDSRQEVVTKNRGNNSSPKPTVDADYLYIRENIEYEDTIQDVSDEKYLVNYYEPRVRNIKNRNSYVKMAKNVLAQTTVEREQYRNIFIPPENVGPVIEANSLLDDTSQFSYEIEDLDYTSEIPFLTKVKLKDTNGDIDQKQDFVNLGNNYLFYANQESKDPEGDIGSLLMRWHLQNSEDFISQQSFSYTSVGEPVVSTQLSCYSFLNWFNDLAPARLGALPEDMAAIKFYSVDAPSMDLAVNNYDDVLEFTKTLNRFATRYVEETLGSTSTKRIEDVFAGTPGNTEILYYKIDKFEGNTSSGTPLQTIVIPNNREDIEYFDTQTIYGKQYTYVINYMVAIHGCEYEYVNVQRKDDGSYMLEVNCYPSVKVIEVPSFIGLGTTLAAPPLVPRVEILPIRRQNNKVKVVFYSGYGNETQRSQPLTNKDNANNNVILQNNFLTRDDNFIEYTSVSTVSNFEVYVATRPPDEDTDYSKFTNSQFASVSTRAQDSDLLADSAALVLELKENKTYYFAFIARNRLGLASNPTNIFKVKYNTEEGISRLEYEEYIFDGQPETRRETKALTKVINIQPVFAQVQPNLEESKMLSDDPDTLGTSKNKRVFLGATDDNMFGFPGTGKKFKFRFKSKNTNKVFDINITCVNNEVKTEFNTESDSISLATDETTPERSSPLDSPRLNIGLAGTVTTPFITVDNFKNYDILEDQNITSRIKKIVPVSDARMKERRNLISKQSKQIRDVFPIDD